MKQACILLASANLVPKINFYGEKYDLQLENNCLLVINDKIPENISLSLCYKEPEFYIDNIRLLDYSNIKRWEWEMNYTRHDYNFFDFEIEKINCESNICNIEYKFTVEPRYNNIHTYMYGYYNKNTCIFLCMHFSAFFFALLTFSYFGRYSLEILISKNNDKHNNYCNDNHKYALEDFKNMIDLFFIIYCFFMTCAGVMKLIDEENFTFRG